MLFYSIFNKGGIFDMIVKVGINGFGCIGCLVFCCIKEVLDDIEVVVINDLISLIMLV